MFSSNDEITEKLLAAKDIDANLIGGFGRLDKPSAPLHYAVTHSDTIILKQLLAVPGINLNVCAARQTPFSAAAAVGRVNTMTMLLGVDGVEIDTSRELIDPPLCQAAVGGCLEAVRLLVKQGERLRINQGTLAMHDMALRIAARAGSLEIVRTLLEHEKIVPDLENRWMESPLKLAVKGTHALVVDALVAVQRVDTYSLRETQAIARHENIRMAILDKIDGHRACRGRIAASRLKAHWPLA